MCKAAGPGLGADRDRGDDRDRDGGAKPHDEGRDHAGPEQPLRQREHQHQDGAGAWPDADRHNGGEAALPAAGAGELFRLRCVRVAPGRSVVVIVVVRMSVVTVMMAVTVIRAIAMGMVVVRMIVLVIMGAVMVMVVPPGC